MELLGIDPVAVIGSGLLVIALTQQARRWVPADVLPLVAMAIGIAVQLIHHVATEGPVTAASVWLAIVTGAVVGLVASGAWDLAGRATASNPAPRRADQPPF
mgnify:CR=1 FL=1